MESVAEKLNLLRDLISLLRFCVHMRKKRIIIRCFIMKY